MQNLLVILPTNSTMIIAVVVCVVIEVAFFLTRVVIKWRGKRDFCNLAELLTEQVNDAKQELENMFLPTHLIGDDDINRFISQHQTLLERIKVLEYHKYYDDDIFEDTDIRSFKSLLFDNKELIEDKRHKEADKK